MRKDLDLVWSGQAEQPMLIGDKEQINYLEFKKRVEQYKSCLVDYAATSVALCMDNSIDWVLIDFACQQLSITLLPLPSYFSIEQINHSVITAGCDLLFIDSKISEQFIKQFSGAELLVYGSDLTVYSLPYASCLKSKKCLPEHTAKITFTSGTTGNPKGVCLSTEHQWQVADSIAQGVELKMNKHLCVLPLATLLENIAGVYAPLLNGTPIELPSLVNLGFNGSSSLDFRRFVRQISLSSPASIITTPELLKGLIQACQNGWKIPTTLRFIAVGGAHIAPALLNIATDIGLPVYQGYGLSECGSVVSLNTRQNNLAGSVGQSLKHLKLDIENGEVVVNGPLFLGYAGEKSSWGKTRYATGDLGYIDQQGFLHIQGRKKNTLISSFGRNINPEWIEACLQAKSDIKQVIVFGDAKPFCCAAIYFDNASTNDHDVSQHIKRVNQQLPDYAQIKSWFPLTEQIKANSNLMTANGRIRRQLASEFLSKQIAALYQRPVNAELYVNPQGSDQSIQPKLSVENL